MSSPGGESRVLLVMLPSFKISVCLFVGRREAGGGFKERTVREKRKEKDLTEFK